MVVEKLKIAYCAPITGLHTELQVQMAEEAGCSKVYRRDENSAADVRGRFVRVLRPDDVAWVADIRVLVARKADRNGVRPSDDFHRTLRAVEATGATIMDGRTGVTSRDGEAWLDLIEWASRRIWSVHRKQVAVNRSLRDARAARPAGIVRMWKSKTMEAQRKAAASIYFDARFSRAQNVARLPKPLCDMHPVTSWRIFHSLAGEHAPEIVTRRKRMRRKRRAK